jgi:antitoxin (DNA-binding transcriptional repressor) of toxin-antitoxin stability system
MKVVTVHHAKTNLSKLINEALDGEEIIIAKGKNPLVKLTVIPSSSTRMIGLYKGKIKISDDFDEELDPFEIDKAKS